MHIFASWFYFSFPFLQIQPLNIPVLTGELRIDGVLDEPFWEQAARYEIKLETYPALLDPSPVKTDVLFGRTEDDIVVGFIAYDPEPEKIQAPLRARDSIELDVDGGRLFSENYLGLHLLYHFLKGSFLRFTIIDDYLSRDQDLYLFEEVDELDRETTMELLYVWKPTQLNTIFIGAKSGAIHTDELNDPTIDATSFYIKFSRAFRL